LLRKREPINLAQPCPLITIRGRPRAKGAMALPQYQSQTQIFSVDIIKPLLYIIILFSICSSKVADLGWFLRGLSRYEF
jgi:hypothetical protein